MPLRYNSCLSVVICNAVCTGAELVYKNVNAGMVNQGIFFESNLKIKENTISTASVFGRIGVGLWTKDRNPTSNPTLNPTPNHTLGVVEIMCLTRTCYFLVTFWFLTKKCPVKHDSSYHIVCAKNFKLQKISSCQQVIAVCANLGILGCVPDPSI